MSVTKRGLVLFLKRLSLTNVRSIRHVELDFAPDDQRWTFLLGENGTGKSTILRSIALVTGGSDAVAELLRKPSDWVRFGTELASIRATIHTAEGHEREVGLDVERGDSLSSVLARNAGDGDSRDNPGLGALDRALEHSQRSYFVTGFGVSRRAGEAQVSTKESGTPYGSPRARSVATLFSADAELTSIESWAMDLDYRRGEEGQDLIRSALEQLLPDVRFAGIDRERRHLLFETPDGTIPYSLLSDGYRSVVGWLGDFLYRITEVFDDYKDPLGSRGLLLLDEIELHLHPKWQRGLVRFLTERLPKFQVVATTHAPLTAHQAGENELYVVQRNDEGSPEAKLYEGAPNKLLLHQLIRSPIFGLHTLDSEYVSSLREEHGDLKARASLSAEQRRRMDQIEETLEDIPNWERDTPEERAKRELLDRIQKRLNTLKPPRRKTRSTAAGKRKPASRKAAGKKTEPRRKKPTRQKTRRKAAATKKLAARKTTRRKAKTRRKKSARKAASKKRTRKRKTTKRRR